jgi:hypothetical protein
MYLSPFFSYLFITGDIKMSVEVNNEKLDQIKQVIVDAVRDALTINKGLIEEQERGNVTIPSCIMKGNDHISIDCNIVLTKDAINSYEKLEPVKHTHKKTDKADK